MLTGLMETETTTSWREEDPEKHEEEELDE
jgi:hypothetical protein